MTNLKTFHSNLTSISILNIETKFSVIFTKSSDYFSQLSALNENDKFSINDERRYSEHRSALLKCYLTRPSGIEYGRE